MYISTSSQLEVVRLRVRVLVSVGARSSTNQAIKTTREGGDDEEQGSQRPINSGSEQRPSEHNGGQ